MKLLYKLNPTRRIFVYHTCNHFKVHKRLIYEQTRSGSMQFENKKIQKYRENREIENLKLTLKTLQSESKWSWKRFKDSVIGFFRSDNKFVGFDDQELIKMWDFNQRNNDKLSSYHLDYKKDKCNDMVNWFVTCDSDYDIGFSKCSWTVSPSGHGLFSGYLDTTIPKDGKIIRTGYAYLGSYKSRKPFFINATHGEFASFTHFVMRVRGDGRRYFIIFDTSDYLDITWFDRYQFIVYTHGGPYWQYVKIPLTRFFFHYQGHIQDAQCNMRPDQIRNVGFLAYDTFSGPFSLEIDYIGFISDSECNDIIEYEGYYHESAIFKSAGNI